MCFNGPRCLNGSRISGFDEDKNEINGPISIAKSNFVTNVEYSDNFDMSFEFKATVVPASGSYHQIVMGKVIIWCSKPREKSCGLSFRIILPYKVSPTGSTGNSLFAMYYDPNSKRSCIRFNSDIWFGQKPIANNWYKVRLTAFVY